MILPLDFLNQFHMYQRRGAKFWVINKRVYIAMDMGLGKTATILLALKYIRERCLIIAPISTIDTTWPQENAKWGFDYKINIIHGPDKAYYLSKPADIYITNFESIPFIYESMAKLQKAKKPFPFSACVIDEGSKIKSPHTKRFKYLDALRSLFPGFRAILSGTPAPESLADLWAQYYFLDDGKTLGHRYSTFERLHFKADPYNEYDKTIRDGARDKIYSAIAPMTYRLDKSDYLELPGEIHITKEIELPANLTKQYKELSKEAIIYFGSTKVRALNKAGINLKLRQFLQGFVYYFKDKVDELSGEVVPDRSVRYTKEIHTLKVEALAELLEEADSPVLCAIQFKQELKMLQRYFPGTPYIAGGVPKADKLRHIDKWNKGELPLLFCHPGSLSHGTNLQHGGRIIVWFCQTWSLEQFLQFNARLVRQGQKHLVRIYYIVFRNTIDVKVAEKIAKKETTQGDLLDFLKDQTNYFL